MILANTKVNGYSLGLPLFWPEDPAQLSSGIIQGISISLVLPRGAIPPQLFVNKYSIYGRQISLTINSVSGIVCSLSATLSDTAAVYALQKESSIFLGGWVTLYPREDERLINLNGAQINPMYVHAGYSTAIDFGKFTLVGHTVSSGAVTNTTVLSSVPLTQLAVSDSPEITVSENGGAYNCSVNSAAIGATPIDNTNIYYVNGVPVSNGGATLSLPSTWVVMGNNLCARVGNPADTSSCPSVDVIQDELGPQNFPGENPLSVAFDANGRLNLNPIYNGTTKFNSEYEPANNPGVGLLWNELSTQHDVF